MIKITHIPTITRSHEESSVKDFLLTRHFHPRHFALLLSLVDSSHLQRTSFVTSHETLPRVSSFVTVTVHTLEMAKFECTSEMLVGDWISMQLLSLSSFAFGKGMQIPVFRYGSIISNPLLLFERELEGPQAPCPVTSLQW